MAKITTKERKSEERLTGQEPVPRMITAETDLIRPLNWYNYQYDNSHMVKYLIKYLEENKFDKEKIELIRRAPDWSFEPTVLALARMQSIGWILPDDMKQRFDNRLEKTFENSRNRLEKKKESVQRAKKYTLDKSYGDVDDAIDEMMENGKSEFNAYDTFRANGSSPKSIQELADKLGIILQEHKDSEIEFSTTPQQRKAMDAFLKKIIQDCEAYSHNTKAVKVINRKPRKKKVKSVDELVKKVKFQKESREFKIASIDPAKIIGAQVLYCFNTKYRNLHQYIAADDKGFQIQNSRLLNVSDQQSLKKLRKPEDYLPQVMSLNKAACKRLMLGIRSTEYKGNCRLDENTVILRVFK